MRVLRAVSVKFVVGAAAALLAVVVLAGCTSAGTPGDVRAAATTGGPSSAAPPAPTSTPAGRVNAAAIPSAGSTSPAAVPNPCEHNTDAKLVKVSITKQHLWLCAHTTIAYSTPITSGVVGQYTSTPTGHYAIQGVNRDTSLTLIDGSSYSVKYWIPFDAPLFGFHDSSWQDFPYGSAKYKTRGSHGCVHMPLKAIRHLARWATIGTAVTIR